MNSSQHTRISALCKSLGETKSPIEAAFLEAFCEVAFDNGYEIARTPSGPGTIAVIPQRPIGRYRADFSVEFIFFGARLLMAVECDGHEFHEKTKEQAAFDRRRERRIVKHGFRVLRFTGSEINSDPRGCAGDVLAMITDFQTARLTRAATSLGARA